MAKKTTKSTDAPSAQPSGIGEKVGRLKEFFDESKVEIKKVTWPTRKETMVTGLAVVILVFVMSIFLGVVDVGLSQLVALILS